MFISSRNFRESWGAKIIFVILAFGMMSFGMSDVISFFRKQDIAIKVGSNNIHTYDLQNAFNRELAYVRAMMPGQYLSPEEAIQMGLLNTTVQKEISNHLKLIMTNDVETVASDDSVRNYIVNNSAFQTMMGQFDRSLFNAYLRQLNLSEAAFTSNLRQELAQKHIFDAIQAVVPTPSSLVSKMYSYENETRDMSILLVLPGNVKISETPTSEILQDYYEALQDELYAPEYRSLSVVRITPQTIADTIVISDQEIQKLFEENKEALSKPEQRQVSQILLQSKEEADELVNDITTKNFYEIAAKVNQTPESSDLGWVSKNSVLEEISLPIFEASVNSIIGPVQSSVGYHILWVKDVEKEKIPQLDDVKNDLIQKAKNEKTYDLMYQKSKEFDTLIGAGESLEKVADSLQLPVEKNIITDAMGFDETGKTSTLNNLKAVREAFSLPENEVSALVDEGDGYLAVRVDKIEPSRLKSFNEVKTVLIDAWTKDMQEKKLKEFAENLFGRIQKGDSFKTVALFSGLEVQNLEHIKRKDLQNLPSQVSEKLFKLEINEPSLDPLNEGFILSEIHKINVPDASQDESGVKVVEQDLHNAITNGFIEESLLYYSNKEGVSVNMPLIEQTFSIYMKPENN